MLPVVAVGISLASAVLIVVSSRRPNLREAWTLLSAVATFVVVAAMLPAVRAGRAPEARLLGIADGIELTLRADTAGMVFGLSASALWILTAVYAIGYVRGLDEHKQTRFFASFAVCIASAVGLALAANLFTFFVFYELLTVATYPLVVHKGSDEARASARRYLAYLLPGGVALLLAMAVIVQATGTLEFTPGGFAAGQLDGAELGIVLGLLIVGFGSKAAIMPLHGWLPAAMVAPTPVSALLHAVAVVKAGVFGFVRGLGYVLGPEALAEVGLIDVLAALAAITILVASVIALRQDNLKRRLAFSTIAHLSYIVLGLALLTPGGWTGGMLHIVNHAVLKITLFFCAGAIYVHTGFQRVSELGGLGRRMPFTMGAFAVASVGLAGLPPVGGWLSKWFLVQGAFEGGRVVLATVLLTSGLFTAGYLFPIAYRAFVPVDDEPIRLADASPLMVVPLSITALLALVLGVGDVLGMHGLSAQVAAAVTGGGP